MKPMGNISRDTLNEYFLNLIREINCVIEEEKRKPWYRRNRFKIKSLTDQWTLLHRINLRISIHDNILKDWRHHPNTDLTVLYDENWNWVEKNKS